MLYTLYYNEAYLQGRLILRDQLKVPQLAVERPMIAPGLAL